MSENDFAQTQGDQYQGSNYANFEGSGIDTQGNVSQAENENNSNNVGTGSATGTTGGSSSGAKSSTASPGLTGTPSLAKSATNAVVGAALPFAGSKIGETAGNAIAGGASFGNALSQGASNFGNSVSGGLVGNAPATAGDAAFESNFGGAAAGSPEATAGAAADSFGSASVGGSIGSGVGTFAADLISGQGFTKSAEAGVASAAGTYVGEAIGSAILPGVGTVVGGFIGGTIGGLFCFTPETEVLMRDGSVKAVAMLRLGDEVLFGGMVQGCGEAFADDIYTYKGTRVQGSHAVLEDGVWLRVRDSNSATKLDVQTGIVCPVATQHHILITKSFVAADLLEIDTNDETKLNFADRLAMLNVQKSRNETLKNLAEVHCVG